jgi:hypothetical protein
MSRDYHAGRRGEARALARRLPRFSVDIRAETGT